MEIRNEEARSAPNVEMLLAFLFDSDEIELKFNKSKATVWRPSLGERNAELEPKMYCTARSNASARSKKFQ